tara:strand:- start:960 stop:1238 length:279 start_codon:yes stop_codon:yes gene_type:complete
MTISDFPFKEKQIAENVFLRYFDHNILSEELIWHQDQEDRTIEIIQSNDWYFQRDEEVPFKLVEGMKFSIKKMNYHRLLRGKDDLIIKVIKY